MNIVPVSASLAILFLSLSSFSLWSEIPLKKAIETGIQADNTYKNNLLDQDIDRLNLQKASMKKFFNLDLSASYLFKSDQMQIIFPDTQVGPGTVIPGKTILAGSKHNYDIKLALSQPLFTGGILSNSIKLEMEKQSLDQFKTVIRKLDMAGKIKSSYFTYRLLENKKKSLSFLVENLKLHRQHVTNFYNEELVKKSDMVETEIKLSETELNLEDLDRLLKEEKINFAKLSTFDIDDVEKSYNETVGTLDETLAYFKTHHPVLDTIHRSIRMLELKKKIIAGSYLPQLYGTAELHYGKPGIDFFQNQWSLYFQGVIGLSFKVFDWNQLKKEKTIIDISLAQLKNQEDELIKEMSKNLGQLYARKESIEKQLTMLGKMVRLGAEDAALKQELYKESQVSNLDYLSALLTHERFRSQENERTVEYQLIQVAINTLIGRYGEEK